MQLFKTNLVKFTALIFLSLFCVCVCVLRSDDDDDDDEDEDCTQCGTENHLII